MISAASSAVNAVLKQLANEKVTLLYAKQTAAT
jgi:hypothetical protein